tara:strand:+ start:34400 stop:36250 length:1851 start_codon:yes stop_codon:yes gene_type:complete
MHTSKAYLRSQIERKVMEQITVKELNEIAKELYPYFKESILEERASLRAHMLVAGHFDLYEEILKEDKILNEGLWNTVADVGITVGQMVGGSVGQAAGVAGLLKYTPEFQNNLDKPFLDWFFPFISVFFSAQALLFPMPATATLKGILSGFAKGVKNIISGAGGILAKGAMLALTKGRGFFMTVVKLFKKAIAGMGSMVGKGGDKVAKLEAKLGGSGSLGKVMKSLKGAIDEFVKRLNVLVIGLKNLGKTNVKDAPGLVKNILTKAFVTSKDKLDDAAALLKGTKAGKAIATAKTKAGRTLEKALKGAKTVTASDDIAKLTIKGAQLKGMGATSAKISGIIGGRLTMNYLDDAGKIIYSSAISGDDLVKILAKNPKVKKWMLSNLDDAGRKVASTALYTASSSSKAMSVAATKAGAKVLSKSMKAFKQAITKASQGGREALSKWLRGYMKKNVDKMDDLLKPLYGRSYDGIGTFVGLTSGGAFKFAGKNLNGTVMTVSKSGKTGATYIDKVLNQKLAGNLLKDLAQIKKPMMDIILKGFAPHIPRVAKELARVTAASQGGGFDDFDKDSYMSPIKSKPSASGMTPISESALLEELIWESRLKNSLLHQQKLINLID